MLTVKQVKNAISTDYDGYEDDFYNEVGSDGMLLESLGKTAFGVDREGGYEGGGEYMHVVFQIDNQFFKVTVSYNSWDANEWDGELEEVEPYEVTVVRYREVKR